MFGIVIENPVTGSLQRISENCYTFEHGIELVLQKNPVRFAYLTDMILLSLLKLGFGNYIFELFSFFSHESHKLPEAFVDHWLNQRTVHLLALLLRLNPDSLHQAFKVWNNISAENSQKVFLEKGLLNVLFKQDRNTGNITIDFNQNIVLSVIPLGSRKASKFARTTSAMCHCSLPSLCIKPRTMAANIIVDRSHSYYSSKHQHRVDSKSLSSFSSSADKKKSSKIYKRKLLFSIFSEHSLSSSIISKTKTDLPNAETDNIDRKRSKSTTVNTSLSPDITSKNSLSFNICLFHSENVLNCKQFNIHKKN